MAKPWGKLEINYINHPKFLALTAGAICLWHEGKNYADMYQTDGRIPREALKTFRFMTRKGVELLTVSCGLKPNGEPYQALWEAQSGGFLMHDYLVHNDCRDVVLARMAKVQQAREEDSERKRLAREAKHQKAVRGLSCQMSGLTSDENPQTVREMSGEMSGRTSGLSPPSVREISGSKQLQKQKEEKQTTVSLSPPKEPADPRVKEFLTWFQTEYKLRRHGADYLVKWERDGLLVKQMLGATGLPRLQKLAQILMSDKTDEAFIAETDRGVGILSVKFNWLSERLAAWEARQKAVSE